MKLSKELKELSVKNLSLAESLANEKETASATKNNGCAIEFIIAKKVFKKANHIVKKSKGALDFISLNGGLYECKALSYNSHANFIKSSDLKEYKQYIIDYGVKFIFSLDNKVYTMSAKKFVELLESGLISTKFRNTKNDELQIRGTSGNAKIIAHYGKYQPLWSNYLPR